MNANFSKGRFLELQDKGTVSRQVPSCCLHIVILGDERRCEGDSGRRFGGGELASRWTGSTNERDRRETLLVTDEDRQVPRAVLV